MVERHSAYCSIPRVVLIKHTECTTQSKQYCFACILQHASKYKSVLFCAVKPDHFFFHVRVRCLVPLTYPNRETFICRWKRPERDGACRLPLSKGCVGSLGLSAGLIVRSRVLRRRSPRSRRCCARGQGLPLSKRKSRYALVLISFFTYMHVFLCSTDLSFFCPITGTYE